MNLKQIFQFITYDPLRKIIAIIFAFGLWFFVSLDGTYQYKKDVRLSYINIRDSLIIIDSLPHISVILTGRGSTLFSTWAAPPKARCNLIDKGSGSYEIPVNSLIIPIPFGEVTITHTIPHVPVRIDTIVSHQAVISVPLKGSLKEGYSISDVNVQDTIIMTGPKEILQTLDVLLTETLDVKHRGNTFSKKIRLAQPSQLVQLSSHEISVEVAVDETAERRLFNIPLKLIFTPFQKVTSEKISLDTLVIKGPRARMDKLTKHDITVRISLTQLSAGDYELPATILLPDYLTPVSSYPKRFSIKIY